MMRLRWPIMCVAYSTALSPQAPNAACVPGTNPAVARLEAVAGAARVDSFPLVLSTVRSAWAPGAAHADALDAAVVDVGQWSVLSEGLVRTRTCVEGTTRATAYFRNTLTHAVDRLRVDVTERPPHLLTAVRVSIGVELAAPPPRPAAQAPRIAALDTFVSGLARRGLFSGVVLLARAGTPVYARAFGTSNERLRTPITLDTPFNLASLNKLMTATAVMQLVEAGQLGLDDSLGALLPAEFADSAAGRVRVKHLLSHTSGFSPYGPSRVLEVPGSSFAYSNFGFLLLGQIIEAKTGMRFEDYLRLEILGPLEMARTARYDLKALSDRVPQGLYYPIPAPNDRLERVPNKYLHIYTGGPMGGMYSTAPDLLRFANALERGRLVRPATLELMKAPKPELGAPEYGFGVTRWQAPGVWGHSGRLPGADADLEFYHGGYTAIVLANLDNVNNPVLLMLRHLFHQVEPTR